MKNLILVLVLLVSGIGYSQENPAKERPRVSPMYDMTDDDFKQFNTFLSSNLNIDSVEQATFKIFNEYRRYVGVSDLEFDTTLQKVALIQSEFMSSIQVATHIHTNTKLRTPPMRLKSVDPNGSIDFVSEIAQISSYLSCITRKRNISENILDLFYYSKSHISMIEDSESTKVGISIVRKNKETFYVVVVFGK